MNETIGVKGGHNDHLRTLRITQEFKRKLEYLQEEQHQKELEELEKKVKQQQRITFLKTLPIVIVGQIYTTLTENNAKKKELVLKEAIERLKKENAFSEKDLNKIIEALKNSNLISLEPELLAKLGVPVETYKRTAELDLTDFLYPDRVVSTDTTRSILKANEDIKKINEESTTVAKATHKEEQKAGIKAYDTIEERINKLKNHKIVEEYELKLKDIRKDLRGLVYEYNVLSDESETLTSSKQAEELLDKLTVIINKMEDLKKALDIPNVDQYDDNYLYTLIEEYLDQFANNQFVDEIKDSDLYIMISNKLKELDKEKDKLQTKVETKKEELLINEESIDEIKEKYHNFDKINNNLMQFQLEQDKLLDEIRIKMSQATTESERAEIRIAGMTIQTRRLMNALTASLFIPGARTARTMAIMTASSMYFMRNLVHPQTVTRRYRTVHTEDYAKEIESSILDIEDITTLIKRTSKQVDITIREVEKEFAEYMNIYPECRELLNNLIKIKNEIKEKEYELEKIKEEQEKNLELNNQKVLTLNYETPM